MKLIKLETARLAKEKGFDGLVLFYQNPIHGVVTIKGGACDMNSFGTNYYSLPTQSLLQKWLREKFGYHVVIIPTVTSNWTFKTIKVLSEMDNDVISGLKSVSDLPPYKEVSGIDFSTYELALEEGLIEILKQI